MKTHEAVEDNLRFLIIEVEKQLDRTARYIREPSPLLLSSVVVGDDYIDNLKTIIQTKCFKLAAEATRDGSSSVAFLKTLEVVAINLERISDFCERVTDQFAYIDRKDVRDEYSFDTFFNEVISGVRLIEGAVFGRDIQLGLSICRAEHNLDRLYGKTFAHVLGELKHDPEPRSRVTVLFIAHYLERMGDSLLNIGEAILSACLGERIKIGQLKTLEESLEDTGMARSLRDVAMTAVGETKSGARVARLTDKRMLEQAPNVIFKEGKTKKLVEERDNIARWQELVPGIAPKIYAFHDGGEDSALLFEYLPGRTFEELLLQSSTQTLKQALDTITSTMKGVWQHTRRDEVVKPTFLTQLEARLEDVYAVHPELLELNGSIGRMQVQSFTSLLENMQSLDQSLVSPFSVFIHGDFNVDNIIYDSETEAVRFIDLHRSRYMDYVQDVSVFLVSNFRLQIFELPLRQRTNDIILSFYSFAEAFAAETKDTTFPLRLALGVARSFATSTRFVLDNHLAHAMFSRSRYLLEQVADSAKAGRLEHFVFPRGVLLD